MTRNVAGHCHELGITIEQLAERSQLARDRAMAIALGRWTPSPMERQKIAAVFDVGIEQISWGHRTPIQHIYGQ